MIGNWCLWGRMIIAEQNIKYIGFILISLLLHNLTKSSVFSVQHHHPRLIDPGGLVPDLLILHNQGDFIKTLSITNVWHGCWCWCWGLLVNQNQETSSENVTSCQTSNSDLVRMATTWQLTVYHSSSFGRKTWCCCCCCGGGDMWRGGGRCGSGAPWCGRGWGRGWGRCACQAPGQSSWCRAAATGGRGYSPALSGP